MIEPELLKRVDDFRFKNRFPTRAAGIKWLLDWALDQKPADPPNEDLPADILADYTRPAVSSILRARGAAALLRLCIQKLCIHLGEEGAEKDINTAIGNLVEKGLPKKIQEALDAVRVIGKDPVHAGEMNIKDNRDTAVALFGLVNFIAERMISEPGRISEIYKKLPATKLKGIQDRDRKK